MRHTLRHAVTLHAVTLLRFTFGDIVTPLLARIDAGYAMILLSLLNVGYATSSYAMTLLPLRHYNEYVTLRHCSVNINNKTVYAITRLRAIHVTLKSTDIDIINTGAIITPVTITLLRYYITR